MRSRLPDVVFRAWLPVDAQRRESEILNASSGASPDQLEQTLLDLIEENRVIHSEQCVNLNPATNIMNPRAEAALSAGLGSRPSLGYAGAKYEMGLEAIEQIEVLAADLACRVFGADYAEIRVGSGALANLYAFMATCQPGDAIIVPPASVAGHVTHRGDGAAGLYGLKIYECPIDPLRYTIDVDGLAALAVEVRPKLITMGASLNLQPHPVAAHACGMFASGQWPSPLDQGADLMTMSTYKSLGGPAGGLVLTNRADLAERIDAIAYPGLTANFDAGKSASLALTLLDWVEFGAAYGQAMVDTAQALAVALDALGLPVFRTDAGFTQSHQFAVDGAHWGDGHQASLRLREANILACAIGLPNATEWSGIRFGTPEVVRWGMTAADMPELAALIHDALTTDPVAVAPRTTAFRPRFRDLHFMR
jgi:glycine hydroxymethyltransferase